MATATFNTSQTLITTKNPSATTPPLSSSSVAFCRRRLRTAATRTSSAPTPSSHITSPPSPYEVLGVQMGATSREIKAAYRKLARTLHPDVATEKEDTVYEFMRVHEAYETLSDPEKRADYDRSLFWSMSSSFVVSGGVSSSAASGFCGFRRRRWETDQCW